MQVKGLLAMLFLQGNVTILLACVDATVLEMIKDDAHELLLNCGVVTFKYFLLK